MQTSGQGNAAIGIKAPLLTLIRGLVFFAVIFPINYILPDQLIIPTPISKFLGQNTTQAPQFIQYAVTIALAAWSVWLADLIASIISSSLLGFPGPLLAKVTIGWKLVHLRNGTYPKKLRGLHDKSGGVVQVGPYEYSVLHPQFVERCQKVPSFSVSLPQPFHSTLDMANIFCYEPRIDDCNQKLLLTLEQYAQNGEEANMVDLIARYAYDTLFTTTVGASPGFLEQGHNISELLKSVENWKFYAMLSGSYLRFHPLIVRILGAFSWSNNLKSQISKHVDSEPSDRAPSVISEMRRAAEGQPLECKHFIEACVAMMVAGSDPAIIHILASLFFTFQDTELVEKLRFEIERAKLSEPPKIKELIYARPSMPFLFAVLDESLRLIQPRYNGQRYVSPKGGIMIAGRHIPEDVNPNIFGANAEAFDPMRWLKDLALARDLRRHMIAFGAGTDLCPGKELHLSIVAKIFTQVISHFDLEMASTSTVTSPMAMNFENPGTKFRFQAIVNVPKGCKPLIAGIHSPLRATAQAFAPGSTTAPELPPGFTEFMPNATRGEHSTSHATSPSPALSVATTAKSSEVSATQITWTDELTLEEIVGRDTTNELITRLDPTLERVPRGLLKTCPITSSRDRYRMHELIERVWGGRLIHQTGRKDNCMYIWAPGSKLPNWLHQLQMNRARNDSKKSADKMAAGNKITMSAEAKAAPVKPARPVNNVWTTFAKDENVRYGKIAAMSGAECEAALGRKKAEEGGEKKGDDQERKWLLKETFKQTGSDTTNGMVGGPRKEISIEHTHHTRDNSTTVVEKAITTEPKKAAVPPHLKPRAVTPPHLRAKSATAENNTKESETNIKDTATDSDEENGVWVAAKLPAPCSSD